MLSSKRSQRLVNLFRCEAGPFDYLMLEHHVTRLVIGGPVDFVRSVIAAGLLDSDEHGFVSKHEIRRFDAERGEVLDSRRAPARSTFGCVVAWAISSTHALIRG